MKKSLACLILLFVVILSCTSLTSSAEESAGQGSEETTTVSTTYEQKALRHLENIDTYTQETFKWSFAAAFCLITILVVIAIVFICKAIIKFIM